VKDKKIKHARRKVTQEQVNAMNREVELRQGNQAFAVGDDGRLTRVDVIYYDWDRVVPKLHKT